MACLRDVYSKTGCSYTVRIKDIYPMIILVHRTVLAREINRDPALITVAFYVQVSLEN